MDKIRIDFFDILGYLVPGTALLLVIWIGLDCRVTAVSEMYNSIHDIDQKTLLLSLFPAYISGFILHALGSSLYDLYLYKKIKKYAHSATQDNWAYVREYGQKHLAILERWYALRAFSQNLAAVSLIAAILFIAKWWQFGHLEWLGFSVGAFLLCWVALRRATIFHYFLNDDIAAVLRLNIKP